MKEKKHYFYIARCKDGSLYCGQTTQLQRRIFEHNTSKEKASKYIWSRRPADLVYWEVFETKSEALRREYEVKQWDKEKKESLIQKN